MGLIQFDKRWVRQPQTGKDIDRENPLSRGLFAGFANPKSPNIRFGTLNSGGLLIVPAGPDVAFSNSTSTATPAWTGNYSPETTELTVLVRAMRYGAQPDSGFGLAVTLVQVSGVQDPFQLFIKNAGERVRVNTTTADTSDHAESSQDWVVNQLQTGVYTWASGELPKMYRNGSLATGTSTTYGVNPAGTLKPSTSLRINNGSLRLNGAVSSVLIWNRALTPIEVAEVSANPWQLFAPRRIWVPVSAASGAPTLAAIAASNLTASGARLTVT